MNMQKISLRTAILININIIIGAGIFLNVRPLTTIAGPFGFLGYTLGALILLPFVFCLGKLAQFHPVSGGLYVYVREYIGNFIGFLSGWSFFIGKTVSAAFLAHSFSSFVLARFSFLAHIPTIFLACSTIFFLIALNILGTHIGGKIQLCFITIKLIPILFIFLFGFLLFQSSNFQTQDYSFLVAFSTIPIALYALVGFETTCSIAHLLINPKKTTLYAILGSFVLTAIGYTLFQMFFFGALGNPLTVYETPFQVFASKIFTTPFVGKLLNACIFTSVIAGSFGILTSNCWNLHALAHDNHLPGKSLLCKTTKSQIPWVTLLIEGIIACGLLLISKNQITLQSMSVFSVTIAFLLNAIAALLATKSKVIKLPTLIPLLAIGSCSFILYLCLQKLTLSGVSFPFLILLLSGILIAGSRRLFFNK